MDKNRVRQLLALWAAVLAGMAAFAAVVLLHLQNNAFLTHSIRHEKQHRKRDLYSRRHTQAFHPDNIYTKNLIIWQRFTKKE